MYRLATKCSEKREAPPKLFHSLEYTAKGVESTSGTVLRYANGK